MKNAKLIYFLRLLPAKDRKQFTLYVASPMFNERESLKRLLEVLITQYILGPGDMSKEDIYRVVYSGKEYNEASLKTNMTQLLGLLRDYLAFRQFKQDSSAQNLFFIRALNSLKEEKHFQAYYKRTTKDLAKAGLDTGEYHHQMMELEREFYAYTYRIPGVAGPDHMKTAVEHLGNSFLIRILRNQIRLLSRASIFQQNHSSPIMSTVMEFIHENLNQLPAAIPAYYHVYEAFLRPNDLGYFSIAKSIMASSQQHFSDLEMTELYNSILNLASRQLNEGNQKFLPFIFEIYQNMLSIGILLDKGQIQARHFKNIVNVGSRLKKFEWVDKFIHTWAGDISPDYARNGLHFNLGTLNYYQGHFEQAERYFNLVLDDYRDVFYSLNARGYLLQIYYETGNSRGLEALSHSFRMYLHRNKEIAPPKQKMYLSFINHLKKLSNIPLRDSKRLLELAGEIKEKNLKGMGSLWILDKIRDLIGDHKLASQLDLPSERRGD